MAFDPETNTLHVRVNPEEGADYKIHFITTKRGFDESVTKIEDKGRFIPLYSEEIGQTVKTVLGTEASYTLAADELYVRARIESNKPSKVIIPLHPATQTAWTQPYAYIPEPSTATLLGMAALGFLSQRPRR